MVVEKMRKGKRKIERKRKRYGERRWKYKKEVKIVANLTKR